MSTAARDSERTKLRHEVGSYVDPHSYVALDGTEHLYGEDWTRRRWEVYDRDEHRCVRCGKMLEFHQAEIDHKIPRSKCRDDRLQNLVTLCAGCHRTGPNSKHI